MDIRGVVDTVKQKMAGIWKVVCSVTVSKCQWLWNKSIAYGSDLM